MATVRVTRYCPVCKRTTKHSIEADGTGALCLAPSHAKKEHAKRVTQWPKGCLSVISSEAYAAVQRARGYESMTPTERLEAAKAYDIAVVYERWKCEVARLLGRNPAELDTAYGDMPRDQWESGTDPQTAADEIRAEDEEHA